MDEARQRIHNACRGLEKFLLQKNDRYRNSIYNPVRLLAKDAPVDLLIRARIDDKISRLVHGSGDDEDVLLDLTGYLILLLGLRDFGSEDEATK